MGWSIFKASFSRTLLVTHRPLLWFKNIFAKIFW
jgi:hypothetical protein